MPTTPDRPADQLRAVVDVLDDAEVYLSVLHGAVGRHDHIGADLTCGGCALRDRLTPALAVARQLLAEGPPAAVWSDGDPLMEVVASAVWEQCRTENSIVVDDPRNIAAVAATVARQLLGTTTCVGVTPSADRRDRYAAAMALRDGHPEWPVQYEDDERDYRRRADAVMAVADAEQASLRAEAEGLDEALRGAISASEKDGARLRAELAVVAPPAPADRAAVLAEAAGALDQRAAVLKELSSSDYGEESFASRELTEQADRLRRLAGEAAAGAPRPEQAHPAEHSWAAELHDPTANEWVPFGSSNVRDTAVHRLAHARKVAPLWKDGTPTDRRLVRATTTYTVEPTPAVPAAPEETR